VDELFKNRTGPISNSKLTLLKLYGQMGILMKQILLVMESRYGLEQGICMAKVAFAWSGKTSQVDKQFKMKIKSVGK
jgi:hypothetical protein